MIVNPIAIEASAHGQAKKAENASPNAFKNTLEAQSSAKSTPAVEDTVTIQSLLPEGIKGDLNGDGAVNEADLENLIANWGQSTSELAFSDRVVVGDVDLNGVVDGADLGLLLANWTVADVTEEPAEVAQAVAVDATEPGATEEPQFEVAEWHADVNTLFRDEAESEDASQFEMVEPKENVSTYFRDRASSVNTELTLSKLLEDLI